MWLQNGNLFQTRDPGADVAKLPPFVYTIQVTMMGIFLEKQQDTFEFPYKLYGLSDFPDRVTHNYKHTHGNLGVMLTGLKGTGKTVEAELICNKLGLPVVLVNRNFDGLVPFLNRLPEDVVIFIDEYEKIFAKSEEMLTLMDGALRTNKRRVFVLTTNEMYISPSMLNRPSRIFYLKRFGNLEEETIIEIVKDMIPDPKMQEAGIKFLASLEIITMDIVKAVCLEMVRFNETPDAFKKIMNVEQRLIPRKTIYHIVGDKEVLISSNGLIDPGNPFNDEYLPQPEEEDKGYTVHFANGEDEKYVSYGELQSFDRIAQTITTSQGVFRISDTRSHPSLKNYMSAAV